MEANSLLMENKASILPSLAPASVLSSPPFSFIVQVHITALRYSLTNSLSQISSILNPEILKGFAGVLTGI
jgi:hypothetical protein